MSTTSISTSASSNNLPSSTSIKYANDPTVQAMAFNVRLWDKVDAVGEKCRHSKHTARLLAELFEDIAKAEKTYATAISKAIQDKRNAIKEMEHEGITMLNAWQELQNQLLERSRAHNEHADRFLTTICPTLNSVRKTLSTQKDLQAGTLEAAQKELQKASAAVQKAKQKNDKTRTDFLNGSKKITQRDVDETATSVRDAETYEVNRTKNLHRVTSQVLTSYQYLELTRLDSTKQILNEVFEVDKQLVNSLSKYELNSAVSKIHPIADTIIYVKTMQSSQPCPWADKGSSLPALPTVEPIVSAATTISITTASSTEGSSAMGTSTISSTKPEHPTNIDVISPTGEPIVILPSPASATQNKKKSSKEAREKLEVWLPDLEFILSSLSTSSDLTTLETSHVAGGSTLTPPSMLAPYLLSEDDWKITSLELVCVTTNLLATLRADQRTAAEEILRVQLDITKDEYSRIMKALTPPASVFSTNSSSSPLRMLRSGKPLSSESMMFVNYRISLCQYTPIGVFGSLSLYEKWCKRQFNVILLTLLCTIEEQASILLQRFQDRSITEEQKQSLHSKLSVYTHQLFPKFAMATSTLHTFSASAHASNVVANDDESFRSSLLALDSIIHAIPLVRDDSTEGERIVQLRYPRALVEKMYETLMMACIYTNYNDLDDDEEEVSGTKLSISKPNLSMHSSHDILLVLLKTLRSNVSVSERCNVITSLRVAMKIIQSQASQEESLLDSPCLHPQPAETSVVPLVSLALGQLTRCPQPSPSDLELVLTNNEAAPEDLVFMQSIVRLLDTPLESYHYCDAPCVFIAMKMYLAISNWLGLPDPKNTLLTLMKISAKNYYLSFLPKMQHIRQKQNANGNPSDSAGKPVDGVDGSPDCLDIYDEAKQMIHWTVDDWTAFADGLCEAISVEAKEYTPAINRVNLVEYPAEITIATMIECFNRDIKRLISIRESEDRGIDEVSLVIISCLNTVRSHLLNHHNLFSSEGKNLIISTFPNLAAICSSQLSRWLVNQKTKLISLRDRVVNLEGAFIPIDAETPHASSVPDLFSILSTVTDGFFTYLERMVPYCIDQLPSFLALVQQNVCAYANYVVASCGSTAAFVPVGDDSYKLKQSLGDQHFLFNKRPVSTTKAEKEMDARAPIDFTDPNSLASKSLETLCVRLACLHACVVHLSDLNVHVRNLWQKLIRNHPIIAPPGPRVIVVGDDIDHSRQTSMSANDFHSNTLSSATENELHSHKFMMRSVGVSMETWKAWNLPLPERMPPLENQVFPFAMDQLLDSINSVAHSVGLYAVYVRMRSSILLDLYAPVAARGSRIRGGKVEEQINELMPFLYKHVQPEIFPKLAYWMLRTICEALCFVFIYGRRVIEIEDVIKICEDDVLFLEDMYKDDVDNDPRQRATQEYRKVLRIARKSTEELMARYEAGDQTLDIPILHVARILGLRSSKKIEKFMKTEREKQKKREREALHNGTGSSPQSQNASTTTSNSNGTSSNTVSSDAPTEKRSILSVPSSVTSLFGKFK